MLVEELSTIFISIEIELFDEAHADLPCIHRKPNPDKPKPWPYETEKFTAWDQLFEDTQDRFDENTRVVVVEGNVGVGKSTLAKQIAERFDFMLYPEATMDFKFIDDEGFDLR